MTAPFARQGRVVWPPLVTGVLIKRYKRFLADVRLDEGRVVTAHCPNTGAMSGCAEPGRPVWLTSRDEPGRKLKYTWEMIDMPGSLVGVDTGVPNLLVKAAAEARLIPELADYGQVRPEVRIDGHTRLDLLLQNPGLPDCYLEIKNCTLVENRVARFPDAVTARGLKHLGELAALAEAGRRAVIFFLIQRMDADAFRPADDIDPDYGQALREAAARGVEILAYDTALDLDSVALRRRLPILL